MEDIKPTIKVDFIVPEETILEQGYIEIDSYEHTCKCTYCDAEFKLNEKYISFLFHGTGDMRTGDYYVDCVKCGKKVWFTPDRLPKIVQERILDSRVSIQHLSGELTSIPPIYKEYGRYYYICPECDDQIYLYHLDQYLIDKWNITIIPHRNCILI